MTKQLTTTTANPLRIDAEHYQVESTSKDRLGRAYDLTFNREQKRWTCNCPDTRHNHNSRCKHIRRLVEWINEQKEASSRIQDQASAVVEQAFAQAEPEPEYREYAPPKQAPAYFTELDNRIYTLESRNLSSECEIAIVGDQLAELRKAYAQEVEKREALEEANAQLQSELWALRAEFQAARVELTGKIETAHHTLLDYANSIRKRNSERYRKQQEEIEALRTQIGELAQVQPVRIAAQVVAVESKNGTKRIASTQEAKPVVQVEIKELERDGRFIGFEIDGYEVRVAHGMVMGCRCPEGQERPCKHCRLAEDHLAKRRETAPLGAQVPFSLMRQ